jgi:ADP-ribosylglycohydrolase
MLGAIAGDIIGSVYESNPIKTTEFPLFDRYSIFTDDTVLTIAIAYAILENTDYTTSLKYFGRKYPDAGYGMFFYRWMFASRSEPYHSWGNGSSMRVSPIGFAFNSIEQVLHEAEQSAAATHNHPDGIKGAQATALAIFLARTGSSKTDITQEISKRFAYNLDRTLDEIRPDYSFDISCQGTVPEAIIAFLDSTDFEDAIRKAISLGGDSDTLACIAGGIAQAFYKSIPQIIVNEVYERLPIEFVSIIDKFNEIYGCEI